MSDILNTSMSDAERAARRAKFKKKSEIVTIWHQFRKNKLAVFGLIVFMIMLILAITAPLHISYEADVVEQHISERLQGPSAAHLFGTDAYGRDIFARVLWGARVSMFTGLAVIVIALAGGIALGATAGYLGGKIDNLIMRFIDIFLAIPFTLLAISIVATLGNSIRNLLLALSVALIPKFTRIIRSSVISLKGQEFIEAAKLCGANGPIIVIKHIIPNALGPIIVEGTLAVARTIMDIASLSFIGCGIQPPNPEWGSMLSDAKAYMISYPYLVYAPGIAIVITAAALTLIGDGLRDALDPKLRN
ncbi:MAG: ABC transporter permease [Lachnospiraceae bacterium]|nr:ABC transporter permease [Lachnospiraceae bacterium]